MHTASSGNPSIVKFSPNCPGTKSFRPQLILPVAIRFDLIGEDGALLAPVPGQVALTVSFEIQPGNAAAASHGILPYPGAHRATLPLDVAWKSDVYR